MKVIQYILLILFALVVFGGCAGNNKTSKTTLSAGDTAYRRIKDICEQEAQGRCWDSVESSPLGFKRLWGSIKQSNCKAKWISGCMEKHGYR